MEVGSNSPSPGILDLAILKPDVVCIASKRNACFPPAGIDADAIKNQILNCWGGLGKIDTANQIHGLAVESGYRDG